LSSLIVGNPSDAHVQAVVRSMDSLGARPPLVVDAPSLLAGGFTLTAKYLETGGTRLSTQSGGTGWLRRYAPARWGAGVVSGSLDSAIHRAFLTLVGCVSRSGNRRWLTRIDEMLRAEDRIVQLEVATSLGISVPRTLIASSAERVIDEFGPRFVVKPLALGLYWGPDGPRAVYTSELDATTARELDFGGAPFMAQELIEAEQHYRIVTALDRAWVASLSAMGRPLDWRRQEQAHHEWMPAEDSTCARLAVRLTQELGVGYSSQDWLIRGDERFFVDLNPGGQWLFLPPEIATDVTGEIARFLAESK
jgi:hypothetical protein